MVRKQREEARLKKEAERKEKETKQQEELQRRIGFEKEKVNVSVRYLSSFRVRSRLPYRSSGAKKTNGSALVKSMKMMRGSSGARKPLYARRQIEYKKRYGTVYNRVRVKVG